MGLLYLILLAVPNLIWTKYQPTDYEALQENKILLMLERAGQVLVSCSVLIFSDLNPRSWSAWSVWLIISVVLMFFYELWWIRYFRSTRTIKDFYSSFWGIPVAGATLPVTAFFLLGLYGKVIWVMLSVIILGIGHIGIHLQHARKLSSNHSNR